MKRSILALATLLLMSGCDSGGSNVDAGSDAGADAGQYDPTDAVFARGRLLDVRVTIDEEDWDALCADGRSFAEIVECVDGPHFFDYLHFCVDVTIDGQAITDVDLRKKGYFGSLSAVRPSLKLKFDEYVDGQNYSGLSRMTLNNNRQDPSLVRQCLAYDLFAKAGLPAPRCNFAHVTVNGWDLGIYTHVESIKKPFLERHFTSNSGNLYEGQVADFIPGLMEVFEKKTNKEENDFSDLQSVVDALDADDGALFESLAQVIDMDVFVDYWIMEVMTAHWDSYSGGPNNFYVYREPSNDLFYFIPWGTDAAFVPTGGLLPEDRPQSVLARGIITNRLYDIPDFRECYMERMRELLDTIWDEQELLDSIDFIENLVGAEHIHGGCLDDVRDVITERRSLILAELDAGGAEWTVPPKDPECEEIPRYSMSGSFVTRWGTIDDPAPAPGLTATLDATTSDGQIEFDFAFSVAGEIDDWDGEPPPIVMIIAHTPTDELYVLQIMFEEGLFNAGTEVPFHGAATMGAFVELDPDTVIGMVADGTVTLNNVSTSPNGQISGSFQATFFETGFLDE